MGEGGKRPVCAERLSEHAVICAVGALCVLTSSALLPCCSWLKAVLDTVHSNSGKKEARSYLTFSPSFFLVRSSSINTFGCFGICWKENEPKLHWPSVAEQDGSGTGPTSAAAPVPLPNYPNKFLVLLWKQEDGRGHQSWRIQGLHTLQEKHSHLWQPRLKCPQLALLLSRLWKGWNQMPAAHNSWRTKSYLSPSYCLLHGAQQFTKLQLYFIIPWVV